MCSVSMVTTDWLHKNPTIPFYEPYVTQHQFALLKIEVEKLKEELKKARAQDIADNAPDCEMQEKVKIIQDLAEKLGVDLEDVFDGHKE